MKAKDRPRGWKRGEKKVPWTDEDWAIIVHAEEQGLTASKFKHLLPGRSVPNIQNALNRHRKEIRKRCSCGFKLKAEDTGYKTCSDCRQKSRQNRRGLLRQGICASCRRDIGPDGSATKCASCCTRRKEKYRDRDIAKFKEWSKKNKEKRTASRQRTLGGNPLRWFWARGTPRLIGTIPQDSKVMDVFGGGGSTMGAIQKAGLVNLGYNDIHPFLYLTMQTLNRYTPRHFRDMSPRFHTMEPDELIALYRAQRTRLTLDPLETATLFLVLTRAVKGNLVGTPSPLIEPLPHPWPELSALRTILSRVEDITNLDFADAIDHYDSPQTVFFLDPPWVGAKNYEYTIDGRHRELVEKALAAQGQFVGILSTSRTHLEDVRGVPFLYWYKQGFGFSKSMVFSSFPLPEDARLDPFNLTDYGVE